MTGTSRQLTGLDTRDFDNNDPRNFLGPDGMVYGFDHQVLYWIKPRGSGRRTDLHTDDWGYGWSATSTAVMFEPGRILQIGTAGVDGRTRQCCPMVRSCRPPVAGPARN